MNLDLLYNMVVLTNEEEEKAQVCVLTYQGAHLWA